MRLSTHSELQVVHDNGRQPQETFGEQTKLHEQISKSHTITAKTRRPLKNRKKTYRDHKKTTESTSGPHTNTEHTKDHTQLKKTHGDHKQLQEAHNHCNILFKEIQETHWDYKLSHKRQEDYTQAQETHGDYTQA